MSLMQWGDKYVADPQGPLLDVRHAECGAPVRVVVECTRDHAVVDHTRVAVSPGASAHPRTLRRERQRPEDGWAER